LDDRQYKLVSDEMITKEELESNLINGTLNIDGSMTEYPQHSIFEIQPKEFLGFAEKELSEGNDDRHLVNSLSNIKRAIDCQIDLVIYNHMMSKKAKKERWNFPEKMGYLQDVGIIAPRILKKINEKRNLLEHEYKKPTQEQVEDALDVATLFIHYISPLISDKTRLLCSSLKGEINLIIDRNNVKFTCVDNKDQEIFSIIEEDKSFEILKKKAIKRNLPH
jgi:hypothetical protein